MLDFKGKFLEKGKTLVCLGDSITAAANGYVSVLQAFHPRFYYADALRRLPCHGVA